VFDDRSRRAKADRPSLNRVEIVLVRHGEPEWVREGLNVDDPPLTGRGWRQARAVADVLAGETFDEIWTSPLVRARQTATPLLAERGSVPESVVQNWLEEIRNPVWHGTPRERAEAAYAEERARPSHERWRGLEGGEPTREFVDRIHMGASLFLGERGVEQVGADLPMWRIDEPARRILLVAHAGTNGVLVSHLLGLSPTPWEWDRYALGHASITRISSIEMGDGHTFCVERLGDVEHLPRHERTR